MVQGTWTGRSTSRMTAVSAAERATAGPGCADPSSVRVGEQRLGRARRRPFGACPARAHGLPGHRIRGSSSVLSGAEAMLSCWSWPGGLLAGAASPGGGTGPTAADSSALFGMLMSPSTLRRVV